MPRAIDPTSATGAKRSALIDMLNMSGISDDKTEALADELIPKFKWIARSISLFFDTTRVLTADEDREDAPGTETEKRQYAQFLALHPSLPELMEFISTSESALELIDSLASVIDHHVSEAKNSDTNTLRHLLAKLLPENPHRDLIDPPINNKAKSERGFNHNMTGALLCPLQYRAEYDKDPRAFNDRVNSGDLEITLELYPSGFYPPKTPFDEEFIEEKLFQGYSFIRALRAIYSGEESTLDGLRTASKASQAEMHGLSRVTPEAVAYTGVHLVFALSSIENWSVAHLSSYDFPSFFSDMVRIFSDPEDEWSTDTLDFLTKKLPPLRKKQMKKRKRHMQDEGQEANREDQTSKSLKNRAARRARVALEHQMEPRSNQLHQSLDVAGAGADGLPSAPAPAVSNDTTDDEDDQAQDNHRGSSSRQRRVMDSPVSSPEPQRPPPSSSPAPSSPPRPPPHSQRGLMGPPPPRYPNTLSDLSNDTLRSRPSFVGRGRSPTMEPDAGPFHASESQSSRRNTLRNRPATKAAVPASIPALVSQPNTTSVKSTKANKPKATGGRRK